MTNTDVLTEFLILLSPEKKNFAHNKGPPFPDLLFLLNKLLSEYTNTIKCCFSSGRLFVLINMNKS